MFKCFCLFLTNNFLLYVLDNGHGGKYNFQSQPHQQHLFPGQRFEDGGFPCSLLFPFLGGAITQWHGGLGVFSHPLKVSLHYLPEEYCGCGCHDDFHIPFQGLVLQVPFT